MYDPVHRVMGMNHFLLANRRYSKDMPVIASDAGRYGIHAMELLINKLLAAGAKKRHLKAKAFGGGNVLGRDCSSVQDNFLCVGAVNVRFVREFLLGDRIPLVAADLGSNHGRQIYFVPEDYSVYVRKIAISGNAALVQQEREFWYESVERQEKAQAAVDFF